MRYPWVWLTPGDTATSVWIPPDGTDLSEGQEATLEPTIVEMLGADILALPLEPARVKWFDKGKGFGFANVFGRGEDVFIHAEVLRVSGLADLDSGEAVALRIVDGKRGRMAVQVAAWETLESHAS